jgi:hypothetical protein
VILKKIGYTDSFLENYIRFKEIKKKEALMLSAQRLLNSLNDSTISFPFHVLDFARIIRSGIIEIRDGDLQIDERILGFTDEAKDLLVLHTICNGSTLENGMASTEIEMRNHF